MILEDLVNCKPLEFKYMRLLAIIYVTFLMAATVMAYKVVNIFGISEPGSTLIYTCTFFLGNVYAELYGSSYTKKLIWESILSGYIFAILIALINSLPSPVFWDKSSQFDIVFGHILRFTNAGVIGFLLSAFLNSYLMTKWKYQLKGKYFWIRSLAASSLSEGVATFITGIIAFVSIMSLKDILYIMTNAFLFKIAYGFIAVWPASFLAFLLKKSEIEITKDPIFNPFKTNE